MINLNTNLSSLITQRSLAKSTLHLNQAIEQMTTGFKINHAKDNAANYNITTNMTTKIGAYMVAEDNCAMGLNLISTAEGSLNTISDKLLRLRALAVQSQNGTFGGKSLEAINQEAEAIVAEIKREYMTTEYNGIKIFKEDPKIDKSENLKNFDSLERVSEAITIEANKSYRIDDATDLIVLQEYVNNGGVTDDVTFELTSNINMAGIEFSGIGQSSSTAFKGLFNGNGYEIQNLKIETSSSNVGLFGYAAYANIEGVHLRDCIIKGNSKLGALVGYGNCWVQIKNCSATGSISGSNVWDSASYIGGLVGELDGDHSKIENCFSNCYVSGDDQVGGLVGMVVGLSYVENCYAIGDVIGTDEDIGGLVGRFINKDSIIANCYTNCNVSGKYNVGGLVGDAAYCKINQSYSISNVEGLNGGLFHGGFIGDANHVNVNNCYATGGTTPMVFLGNQISYYGNNNYATKAGAYQNYATIKSADEIFEICTPEVMGFTEANGWKIVDGTPRQAWEKIKTNDRDGVKLDGVNVISFQVGTNSGSTSELSFDLTCSLIEIDDVMGLGLADSGCLSLLDSMILRVSDKAIEYGAMQNRLESALDEISVQYENLVSSRSTLRDADISEVSSEYIRQQILQQASATLMATANQSPSIALQLI